MIIEYSNAKEPKNHANLSVAIVVTSCAFFFIPTTLIVLGYLASQPTGTLVSPLPQGTLSEVLGTPSPSPTPLAITPQQTVSPPVVAAASDATSAATNLTQTAGSNIIDKTASISAGLVTTNVSDPDIKQTSQVYLSPRQGDTSVYSVKSKGEGKMQIEVNTPSDTLRYVDYHIVNP